jgi:DNA-binding transcriptional MerR regulator
MSEPTYTIQELTELTGVARRTIHFYTQQGILPAPTGAGLGARYGREHFLRLKLVPVLRREGLRLDDIRERFAILSRDEMEQILESAPAALQPTLRAPSARAYGPGAARSPQSFSHYPLPAGITIVAPVDLSKPNHRKLSALLEAAARIFGPPRPPRTT